MALDLFGEIPVTKCDIRRWLRQHTQIDPDAPRAEYYIRHYNVADKVRREKAGLDPRPEDVGR